MPLSTFIPTPLSATENGSNNTANSHNGCSGYEGNSHCKYCSHHTDNSLKIDAWNNDKYDDDNSENDSKNYNITFSDAYYKSLPPSDSLIDQGRRGLGLGSALLEIGIEGGEGAQALYMMKDMTEDLLFPRDFNLTFNPSSNPSSNSRNCSSNSINNLFISVSNPNSNFFERDGVEILYMMREKNADVSIISKKNNPLPFPIAPCHQLLSSLYVS
jgi:hypothetical protein